MLDLRRLDGSLAEDSSELQGMFSTHFQSIFAPYDLTSGVLTTHDACCKVVPCKVSSGD